MYDFREIDSSSLIGIELTHIKDAFFNSQEITEHLESLKDAFAKSFINESDAMSAYAHCLQSLIYLLTHMKQHDASYENKSLNSIIYSLESINKKFPSIIPWSDPKEGVNVFHALARSRFKDTSNLERLYTIFADSLAMMLLKQDKKGFTALNTAIKEGKIYTVTSLLDKASQVLSPEDYQTLLNKANDEGYTPFISAYAEEGLLNILYQKIDDLNTEQGTDKGYTCLNLAAKYGKTEAVDWLLRHGANPATNSNKEESPLLNAITGGHLECADQLMTALISDTPLFELLSSEVNQNRDTLFHKACYFNQPSSLSYLLENAEKAGSDCLLHVLLHENKQGHTMLDVALDVALLGKNTLKMQDEILGYAAKVMNLEQFINYSSRILWGNNSKSIVPLLYHAKSEFTVDKFNRLLNQKSGNGLDLREHWKANRDVVNRIDKYRSEKNRQRQAFFQAPSRPDNAVRSQPLEPNP